MSVLHWLNRTGVFSGVLVMWLGSLPVVSGLGALIHRAEKRHREHQATLDRLTAAYLAHPPKE